MRVCDILRCVQGCDYMCGGGDRVAGNIYTGNNDRRRKYPEEREVRVRYVGDLDIRCKRSAVRKMPENDK